MPDAGAAIYIKSLSHYKSLISDNQFSEFVVWIVQIGWFTSSGLKKVPVNQLTVGSTDILKMSEYPIISPFPSSKLNAVGNMVEGISSIEKAVLWMKGWVKALYSLAFQRPFLFVTSYVQ